MRIRKQILANYQ